MLDVTCDLPSTEYGNSNWLISKLQFQYDLNTNLIIFPLLTAIGFSICIIFTVALLLWTKISDRRVTRVPKGISY